jgi:hypothetical protein
MSYERYLNKLLDELFAQTYNVWSWHEFAQMAGVSYSTVYRLGKRITRFPHLRTVFLLARAVNINLPTIKVNRKIKVGK